MVGLQFSRCVADHLCAGFNGNLGALYHGSLNQFHVEELFLATEFAGANAPVDLT